MTVSKFVSAKRRWNNISSGSVKCLCNLNSFRVLVMTNFRRLGVGIFCPCRSNCRYSDSARIRVGNEAMIDCAVGASVILPVLLTVKQNLEYNDHAFLSIACQLVHFCQYAWHWYTDLSTQHGWWIYGGEMWWNVAWLPVPVGGFYIHIRDEDEMRSCMIPEMDEYTVGTTFIAPRNSRCNNNDGSLHPPISYNVLWWFWLKQRRYSRRNGPWWGLITRSRWWVVSTEFRRVDDFQSRVISAHRKMTNTFTSVHFQRWHFTQFILTVFSSVFRILLPQLKTTVHTYINHIYI